jgi:hypothetical protein
MGAVAKGFFGALAAAAEKGGFAGFERKGFASAVFEGEGAFDLEGSVVDKGQFSGHDGLADGWWSRKCPAFGRTDFNRLNGEYNSRFNKYMQGKSQGIANNGLRS